MPEMDTLKKKGKLGNVWLRNRLLRLWEACSLHIPRQRNLPTWLITMKLLQRCFLTWPSASWDQTPWCQCSLVVNTFSCNVVIVIVVVSDQASIYNFSKQTRFWEKTLEKHKFWQNNNDVRKLYKFYMKLVAEKKQSKVYCKRMLCLNLHIFFQQSWFQCNSHPRGHFEVPN